MIPPVFPALNTAGIRAYVGTNPVRIYAAGVAPLNTPLPYITWQVIAASPQNNLSDSPHMDDQRVRINVWASAQQQAGALGLLVRDALESVTHLVFGPIDDQDDETGAYRWLMDAEFWSPR
jgi:hypothetical protein